MTAADNVVRRAFGPGWIRMSPLDRAGRRAIWISYSVGACDWNFNTPDGMRVALRSGRDGGDAFVSLHEGDRLTRDNIRRIVDVIETMRFGLIEYMKTEESAVPDGDPCGTCDWGRCDKVAKHWRRWRDGWLAVCRTHRAPVANAVRTSRSIK